MYYIKNSLLIVLCFLTLWLNAQTSISGNISTVEEVPLAAVTVTISNGNFTLSTLTNEEGDYSFDNLSETENLTFDFIMENNNDPLNGVSTLDFVMGANHILGKIPFDIAYQYIVMDINKSGSITAFDLVQMRNLILGITTQFPDNDAWRFIEKTQLGALTFSQSNTPEYEGNLIPIINLTIGEKTVMDFVGIKIGDASGNADIN